MGGSDSPSRSQSSFLKAVCERRCVALGSAFHCVQVLRKNDLLYDDVRLVDVVCVLAFLSCRLVSFARVFGMIDVI